MAGTLTISLLPTGLHRIAGYRGPTGGGDNKTHSLDVTARFLATAHSGRSHLTGEYTKA